MTVMPPSDSAPTVEAVSPTNGQIMEVLGDAVLSQEQLCDRLRTLFARTSTPVQSLEAMQAEILEVNVANGWFEGDRSVGDDIALLHSEVSEMYEAYRDQGLEDATLAPHNGREVKPEGFGSEAADVLIRLLDTCERRGIDLRFEYERKIRFNRTRGYKHGGKKV